VGYWNVNSTDFARKQVTGSVKTVHWSSCCVALDGDVKWLFDSCSHGAANASPALQEDCNSSAHDSNMYVMLSGFASAAAAAASLYVLRAPRPLDVSKAADINQSVQSSRCRSSSDAPLPSSYSAMSLVAVLPAAADKEITRLTMCAGSQQHQALIIASSMDGCVRGFKMSAGLANAEFPYMLVSVWLIPAVKSELKEWYIQPLPHMTASNKVLDDDADGNEAEQQPWLQAPQGLLPSQAAKSPSAAGNRLRGGRSVLCVLIFVG
jgi:hypothetical protein